MRSAFWFPPRAKKSLQLICRKRHSEESEQKHIMYGLCAGSTDAIHVTHGEVIRSREHFLRLKLPGNKNVCERLTRWNNRKSGEIRCRQMGGASGIATRLLNGTRKPSSCSGRGAEGRDSKGNWHDNSFWLIAFTKGSSWRVIMLFDAHKRG